MLTRETVTSLFESVGLLLLAVAGGVLVARWSLAGGLATGGVLLIAASALTQLLAPRPPRRAPGDESA